ncbi:Parvulin-like peptidyl-prolyl isomerase [Duganella sp. CF458]|uniref:peptidylprolyl isomerase n=1 Tax=Duganella sp. CF458 TaxID=1884368 RepID=UPI0008DFB3A5|nr:peptidylprolyl isomerase [Duganella sp. CF458]SFF78152.1 Parvulin-like peptidyl-prolyl isomerase [Duganella sp. CF458]
MAARHFVQRAARAAAAAIVAATLTGANAVAGPATPDAAAVAARIDGKPIYVFTLDTLWQQRRARKPALERRAALDDLVQVRLLAAHAGAPAPKEGASLTVAFAPDVVAEERLVATLREVYGKDIDAAVKALPGATLDSLVTAQQAMPPQQLEAVFGRPGQLKLEIALSDAQLSQAGAVEVLRYQLPGGEPAKVTLFNVYHRQNVQGRLALSQQPAAVAAQQARRIVANAFVQHWARQRFGAEAVADLRKALADGEAVVTLQQLHGVGLDTDSGSPLLNRLAGDASPQEIEAFYHRNKDQFARIDKIRARHIRVANETQAQRVLKALRGGADFAATARKMSRASDAAKGGDLGWISADGDRDWLASLAFSQQPGKPSAPIRAPVGPNETAYWEIVLVEEQVHGAHPLRSETVRYQASRMIALKKAMQQLSEMTDQARRSAQIEIAEVQ